MKKYYMIEKLDTKGPRPHMIRCDTMSSVMETLTDVELGRLVTIEVCERETSAQDLLNNEVLKIVETACKDIKKLTHEKTFYVKALVEGHSARIEVSDPINGTKGIHADLRDSSDAELA